MQEEPAIKQKYSQRVNFPIITRKETKSPYICGKLLGMETTNKSRGLYWLLFFASVASFFLVYAFAGNYITVTLPFICYFFAKALDII